MRIPLLPWFTKTISNLCYCSDVDDTERGIEMAAYSSFEKAVFMECETAAQFEEIIFLDIAMVIASWWHSPGSPNSTRLSTMGKVTCDMRMRDFATEDEYKNADPLNRLALESLDRFIRDMQNSGDIIHTDNCECGEE